MDFLKEVFGFGQPTTGSKRRQQPSHSSGSTSEELVNNTPFSGEGRKGVLADDELRSLYEALKHPDTDISLGTFENSADLKDAVSFVIEEQLFVSLALRSDNINYKISNISAFLTTFFCVPTVMKALTGTGSYMVALMTDHLNTLPTNSYNDKLLEVLIVILARAVLFFKKEAHLNKYETTPISPTLDNPIIKNGEMNALIVDLIILRLSKVIPSVLTVSEYLPLALDFFTTQRLGVIALAGDIKATIKRLALKVRGDLSDEILNGDVAKIQGVLAASVDHYFKWIETNKVALMRACLNAEVVACVDPTARAWLRGEEYSSATEIVIAYRQKYKRFLTGIMIVSSRYGDEDISQARKDLRREVVSLNSKTIDSSQLEAGIKGEYIKVLAYLSGFESPMASRNSSSDAPYGTTVSLHADSADSADSSLISATAIDNCVVLRTASLDSYQTATNTSRLVIATASSTSGSPCAASKSTINGYSPVNISARRANSSDSYDHRSRVADTPTITAAGLGSRSSFSRFSYRMRMLRRFDRYENLLTLLVNHTLLAASRTSAGGDAFVIVEDIYGGEGTVLCPRSRRRSSGDTSSNDGSASSSSGGGVDSVDLTIDASCAVIKIVEEYDLFSKLILEQTVINNSHVDGKAGNGRDSNSGPLISFRCTTETTVSFAEAEVSVGGSNGDVGIVSSVSGEAVARSNSTIDALYLTLLSSPDKMVTKRVTISPLIYDDAYRPPREKL